MQQWKISVRIKIGITFIFRSHCRPIQLVVFVPASLSSFLRHLWKVDLPEMCIRTTKGLQKQTQLIEWDDSET